MKKRGFTLIELLAVIVILAIVALVAVPMITKQIEATKKGSAEGSCHAIEQSAANFFVIAMTKNPNVTEFTFTCDGKTCESDYGILEFKGSVPTSGVMRISGPERVEIIEDLVVNGFVCKRESRGNYNCLRPKGGS